MGYPTSGRLAEEIETAICENLNFEDQTAHCENGFRPPKAVHWQEVKNFLTTATSWFVAGRPLVAQEEAERRAGICVTCPYNVGLAGCAICTTTLGELREKLLKRSTIHDPGLNACGICGCDNKTQVHVPINDLRAGKPDSLFPEWCWLAPSNRAAAD